MKTEAENCPWCHAEHDQLALDEVQPGVWAVICPNCGAIGPHPTDRLQPIAEAVDRWDGLLDVGRGIEPKDPPLRRQSCGDGVSGGFVFDDGSEMLQKPLAIQKF